MNHILITGVPGIGKTTLVKNLVELLRQSNSSLKVNLDGFLTEEKRNQNLHRIGFQVRLIKSNSTTTLADKRNVGSSEEVNHLGQYTVYVKNFEELTVPLIDSFENGILVLDEIGKMELFSKKFQNAVATAFQRFNVKILATVPVKGPHFVENLKKNNNCRVIMVTQENRNNLLNEVYQLLLN